MRSILAYLKKEIVLTIAWVLAIGSMCFVKPDQAYMEYIDVRVLVLLFCLMLLVKGFQSIGVFDRIIQALFQKVKSTRMLGLLLVMLCFFMSMLITNDVALITFVPFAILALGMCHQKKLMIRVVVLQTIAANLGSMFTPIGNPQNLYLFSVSDMGLGAFFMTMMPITLVSLVMLAAAILMIQDETIAVQVEDGGEKVKGLEFAAYSVLFVVNLLVVLHVIDWPVALVLTVMGVLLVKKATLLKQVDYGLLITFVGFFVFVGNIGRIPAVSGLLEELIQGREILVSALFSQVLSNVPAAILLSGFTDNMAGLLVGTNVGGLGTLIASMASLISYKLYAEQKDAAKGRYMLEFTVFNVVGLVILLSCCALVYGL